MQLAKCRCPAQKRKNPHRYQKLQSWTILGHCASEQLYNYIHQFHLPSSPCAMLNVNNLKHIPLFKLCLLTLYSNIERREQNNFVPISDLLSRSTVITICYIQVQSFLYNVISHLDMTPEGQNSHASCNSSLIMKN